MLTLQLTKFLTHMYLRMPSFSHKFTHEIESKGHLSHLLSFQDEAKLLSIYKLIDFIAIFIPTESLYASGRNILFSLGFILSVVKG